MSSGGKVKKKDAAEGRQTISAGDIEKQSERMQEFVYIVSHDLGSPLFSIDAFSVELGRSCERLRELLDREKFDGQAREDALAILDSDVEGALDYIRQSVREMNKLLEGLKRVSRVGSKELKIEVLDMNELVGEVASSMRDEIEKAGVVVKVEELPGCVGDADLVNKLFGNILSNSVRFLDCEREGSIYIRGRVEGGQSVYEIEDNGIGIAEKHLEKIFEVFWRQEAAGTSPGEGLGLTIAKRIVDRLGGRIGVESKPGEGSRFYVSLPKG